MADKEIRIAYMYPDVLFLHGERGNVLALEKWAGKMGMEPRTDRIDLGRGGFDPTEYDILFYGPGEISVFPEVIEDIAGYDRSLAEFIASGKTLIATGTTAALFGEKIIRQPAGGKSEETPEIITGLCMLPLISKEREYVFGDDEWIVAEYNDMEMELIGSQIMMVDVDFNECGGFRRFGSVYYGRGNNGTDGIEGIVHGSSIFTNMLGPILVNNPWLTVEILKQVAEFKGYELEYEEQAYEMELKSIELKKKFILDKMREDSVHNS